MATDPNKKTLRHFQCRDHLWETFEQMSAELECSVDYLINESMRQYARSRNYGLRGSSPGMALPDQLPVERDGAFNEPPPPPPARASVPPPPPPVAASPARAPVPPMPSLSGSPPATPRVPSLGAPMPGPRAPSLPAMPAQRPAPVRAPNASPPMPMPMPMANAGRTEVSPPFQPMSQGPAAPPVAPPPGLPKLPPMPSAGPSIPPPMPSSRPEPIGATAPTPGTGTLYAIYQGERYPVTKEEFIIGRGQKTSDLVIRDSNVSRRHAIVILHNGHYWIVDQQSTNGVEFMGARIDRKRIEHGDVFKICDYEILFTYD